MSSSKRRPADAPKTKPSTHSAEDLVIEFVNARQSYRRQDLKVREGEAGLIELKRAAKSTKEARALADAQEALRGAVAERDALVEVILGIADDLEKARGGPAR